MDKDEIKEGMLVNYHSFIGGPVTKGQCVVISKPWQLGCGEWVVLISGMSGGVSLDALTVVPLIIPNCNKCLHYTKSYGCHHNKKIIKGKCIYFTGH